VKTFTISGTFEAEDIIDAFARLGSHFATLAASDGTADGEAMTDLHTFRVEAVDE
jgi:hypothetical protein